jgi:hypothetical protein
MNSKEKKAKANKLSLAERREYTRVLFEQFQSSYPFYFPTSGDLVLPKATFPSSMANVKLDNKEMANTGLNPIQLSVLCGTAFGDSFFGIQKSYKNARVQNRHSTRQADWFFWKWTVALPLISNGLSSSSFQEADGKQKDTIPLPGEVLGKLKFTSKATPELTTLATILNKKGSGFSRTWLNHMNNYFLMTLFLDDGSLGRGDQANISLESFTKEKQAILVQYLKAVWGIHANVMPTGQAVTSENNRPGYRVALANNEETLKLLRLIAPIMPVRSMLYKLYFVPVNNRDVLQRWATELEQLVIPQFREEVKNHYQMVISNYNK